MKKRNAFVGIVLLIVLGGCTGLREEKSIRKVCFNETCYSVELAETNEERETGLMHRESLDADRGMLFVYDKDAVYVFWMKDTLIPLDMIWLESDGTVARIVRNATPCTREYCPSINPNRKARYVLEINGGQADKIGLSEGSRMEFRS